MPPLLPLEFLHNGDWGDIAEITGEPSWVHRLAELGVRTGCRVCVLQGGSPCLVEIGGVRISVRSDLATHILVRPRGVAEAVA